MRRLTATAVCLVALLVFAPATAAVASGQVAPNGTNTTNVSTTNATAANTTNTTNLGPGVTFGAAANVTNSTANTSTTAAAGTGTSGSGGAGFGIGMPSSEDIAASAVNATFGTVTDLWMDAMGTVFMLPWQLITVRFAPFEAASDAASGPSGLWSRPNAPVFGQLYDLAMGSFLSLAGLLFVLMFVLDWFGNLSPNSPLGALDRLFLRAADSLHLLFSWPIAWGHFLLASAICALLLPNQEEVVGSLGDGLAGVAGVAGGGFALIFSTIGVVIAAYLMIKHFGAFVYLIVGLAAYPLLVATSIPDHWLLGRLGAAGENARARYPVAAWYPVPTVVVLAVGYAIDEPFRALFEGAAGATGAVGGISAGILFYPVLWLAALYAPAKTFSEGGLADQAKRAAPGAIAGGAAGAATGSAAGASAGAASGSAAGAASGGASAGAGAIAGAGSSAAGALPEGRFSGQSAGANTLVGDGGTGTATVTQTGTTGGSGGGVSGETSSFSSSSFSPGPESVENASDVGAISPPRAEFDTGQRYEPVVQRDGDWVQYGRVPPRNAEWLVDRGGADRLDGGADKPLYFKGESDGQLYDLRRAAGGDVLSGGNGSSSDAARDTR